MFGNLILSAFCGDLIGTTQNPINFKVMWASRIFCGPNNANQSGHQSWLDVKGKWEI